MARKGRQGGNGRKPLLARSETLAEIKRLAELGLHDSDIYNMVGVSEQTWSRALVQAEADIAQNRLETPYVRFRQLLLRARSKGRSNVMTHLNSQSAQGNDRSSKFLMELDENYRSEKPGASVNVTVQTLSMLTDEQLDRFLAGDRSVLVDVQK